jgi:GNAT superfamily N-acetyltransferase
MGLYVRASTYGTGVGFALLQEAIGDADAYLWVLDGNDRAIRFYERQGFRCDGTTKPEDVGLERRMVRR